MKLFKQTNHILLWEPTITPPSWHYKARLPQPLLIHSVPKYNSYVTLFGMLCPPPRIWYVINKLLAISFVSFVIGVMCLAIPITLKWDSMSHLWGEEQAIQTWLHLFVNTLKTTELYTLKGWILWYVNYKSVQKSWKNYVLQMINSGDF